MCGVVHKITLWRSLILCFVGKESCSHSPSGIVTPRLFSRWWHHQTPSLHCCCTRSRRRRRRCRRHLLKRHNAIDHNVASHSVVVGGSHSTSFTHTTHSPHQSVNYEPLCASISITVDCSVCSFVMVWMRCFGRVCVSVFPRRLACVPIAVGQKVKSQKRFLFVGENSDVGSLPVLSRKDVSKREWAIPASCFVTSTRQKCDVSLEKARALNPKPFVLFSSLSHDGLTVGREGDLKPCACLSQSLRLSAIVRMHVHVHVHVSVSRVLMPYR